MSRAVAETAFRYTPGNGYVYTWNGVSGYIDVYRVETDEHGTRREAATGERIQAPERRTAQALMAAVDHRITSM